MGTFSKLVWKGLLIAALLGFVGMHATKADTLSGTTGSCTTSTVACWTNITVTATDYGYPGVNTSIDTVEFFTNSGDDPNGLEVLLVCTSDCTAGPKNTANSASLYGSPAVFTGSTTAPVIDSTTAVIFNSHLDHVNDGGAGTYSTDPTDNFSLVALGSGNFNINSGSINLYFTLPEGSTPPVSTPEPTSSLMLGIGLLGLMGLGLRRQGLLSL